MTDSIPLDDRDALASSYLDGLTTPAQTAQVEADPEMVSRVAAMQRVRSALALTTTVDEEQRDQAIAAAMAAYDEDTAVAPLRHLAGVSGGRHAPSPRAWQVLGVAAAVAALVALVPLLASLSSSSPDDDRIELADDQSAGTAGAAGRADATTAPAEAMVSTTTPSPDPLSTANWSAVLGSFATDEALVAAIGAPNVESPPIAEVPPGIDRPPCFDVLIRGLPTDETVVLTTATVAGAPVAVGVTPTEVRITGGDCSAVRVYLR